MHGKFEFLKLSFVSPPVCHVVSRKLIALHVYRDYIWILELELAVCLVR